MLCQLWLFENTVTDKTTKNKPTQRHHYNASHFHELSDERKIEQWYYASPLLPYAQTTVLNGTGPLAPNEGGTRCGDHEEHEHGKLRIYMREHSGWSWGRRVCGSLRGFSPSWVCWASDRRRSDVEFLHVDGEMELLYARKRAREVGDAAWPPLVVFQHGLTQQNAWQPRPPRSAYLEIWRAAVLTVSFQDLKGDADGGGAAEAMGTTEQINRTTTSLFSFYEMPWGANKDVFVPHAQVDAATERTGVLIFGNLGETPGDDESNGAVLFAAAKAGVRVRHVGDPVDSLCHPCPGGIPAEGETDTGRLLCQPLETLNGLAACAWHDNLGRVSDEELVSEYQRAKYVLALRKYEGFESIARSGSNPVLTALPMSR